MHTYPSMYTVDTFRDKPRKSKQYTAFLGVVFFLVSWLSPYQDLCSINTCAALIPTECLANYICNKCFHYNVAIGGTDFVLGSSGTWLTKSATKIFYSLNSYNFKIIESFSLSRMSKIFYIDKHPHFAYEFWPNNFPDYIWC